MANPLPVENRSSPAEMIPYGSIFGLLAAMILVLAPHPWLGIFQLSALFLLVLVASLSQDPILVQGYPTPMAWTLRLMAWCPPCGMVVWFILTQCI